MEKHTRIRIELQMAAQQVINQFMVHNENLEKEIVAGINKAINDFDFEDIVAKAVTSVINEEIRRASNWDKLSNLVREKANKIVDDHVEKHMAKLKENL